MKHPPYIRLLLFIYIFFPIPLLHYHKLCEYSLPEFRRRRRISVHARCAHSNVVKTLLNQKRYDPIFMWRFLVKTTHIHRYLEENRKAKKL